MLEARAHHQLKALLRHEGGAPWPHHLSLSRLVARSLHRGDQTLVRLVPGSDPSWLISLLVPLSLSEARLAMVVSPALRQRLPTQAATVHRLLGAHSDGFVHGAEHPLPIDLLVVDEASMLDLALATRLMAAVPDSAHIVLLGDKDQLAAVESGAVFAELGADPTLGEACRNALAELCGVSAASLATPPPAQASPLRDAAVWFTRNHRFAADSGIARAAAHIRRGDADALLELLRESGDASLHWLQDGAAQPTTTTLQHIADGFAPYFDCVQRDPRDVAAIHQAFERFRVLCAVRDGPRGVLALNDHLSRLARARLQLDGSGDAQSPWYPGRPVMVLRNDPLLQLFNGDIGIALPDADGVLKLHFPAPDGGFRALAPVRLPAHESAFAMTVHKSQGSEFDALLLLLPEQPGRVLTRELLYTAITRARRQVALAASATVLTAAVGTATQRHPGLLARLREAAGAG